MKKEGWRRVAGVVLGVLCFVTAISAAGAPIEEAQMTNRIVAVSAREGLSPATMETEPGTTVIWVNHSNQPAEILFLDKKVTLACGSPVNFFIGKDGAYESAKIPFGGTASLCFTEKGQFEYLYKASATFYPLSEKEHKGIIWIK